MALCSKPNNAKHLISDLSLDRDENPLMYMNYTLNYIRIILTCA